MSGTAAERVGIDVGGSAIKAGRVGADGSVHAKQNWDAPHFDRGPAHVLDGIAELARSLGVRDALGIGVPGLLDRARGFLIESPNLPNFKALDVRGELARRLGLDPARVHVENDANAAAVGEQWLGGARGERDALVLTLGTGIGGGLILNGELFAGEGMAGEVGHVVIAPGGRACGCGRAGCVEQYASATAARRRALEAGLPKDAPGDLKRLTELARTADGAERALCFEVGRDLGRGLGPVLCLLDIRCFVFGGGFSAALDVLEPGIRAGIEERSYGERQHSVRLLRATLGPKAGWIGAAKLAF
ncbi:MAG: ROK family protein [Planctomycetes bacterium]|nr:ROK family protein [Planctomycetota bacterium]